MTAWKLGRRFDSEGGAVAYDVFGEGPPLVLVHGTPSWSFLWRNVVPTLSRSLRVHVFDLLGYGGSEQHEGQHVSIAAQARILGALLDHWGIAGEEPSIVGHDIGGAIVLGAHLLDNRPFRRIALVDAVVLNPWNTPTTFHIKEHIEAYRTMPAHIYEQVVRAHLRTALYRRDEEIVDAYFAPWAGQEGQAAYFRKVAQFDEDYTGAIGPLLKTIRVPVRIIWGEQDAWLKPNLARRISGIVPGSEVVMIPEAGHFAPEDAPDAVAAVLAAFFGAG